MITAVTTPWLIQAKTSLKHLHPREQMLRKKVLTILRLRKIRSYWSPWRRKKHQVIRRQSQTRAKFCHKRKNPRVNHLDKWKWWYLLINKIIRFHLVSGWKMQGCGRIMRARSKWYYQLKYSITVKLLLLLSSLIIDIVNCIPLNNMKWTEKLSVQTFSFPMMNNTSQ